MAWHYYDSTNPIVGDPTNAQHGDFIIDGGNGTSNGLPTIDTYNASSARFSIGGGSSGLDAINNYGWSDTVGNTVWIKGNEYWSTNIYGTDLIGTSITPIRVSNYDGQVEARAMGWGKFRYAKISGEYAGGYGDINYQGHLNGWGGHRKNYGFYVNNRWQIDGAVGFQVYGSLTTDVEISYIETGNGGFAGMMVKQNHPDDITHWDNIHIHDCYFHDTYSEGIYLGIGYWVYGGSYTSTRTEHGFTNLEINNNLFERCGSESIQINNLLSADIHHNTVIFSSALWRDPWDIPSQDGAIQVAYTTGVTFRDNFIYAGGRTGFNFVPNMHIDFENDFPSELNIYNNYWGGCKGALGYFANGSQDRNTIKFQNNYLDKIEFVANDIFKGAFGTAQAYYIGFANSSSYITTQFSGNKYVNSKLLTQNPGLNSGSTGVSSLTDPEFRGSDFLDSEIQNVEHWIDYKLEEAIDLRGASFVSGYSDVGGDPQEYPLGAYNYRRKIGSADSEMYQLISGTGVSGGIPIDPLTDDGTHWQLCDFGHTDSLPLSDFVLASTSPYAILGMGINDNQIANQSPTVNSGENKSLSIPDLSSTISTTFTAIASDPDGTIASYLWTKQSGGTVTLSGTTTDTLSVSDVGAGTYIFRCTVTDNLGLTASDDVQLIVSVVNNFPIKSLMYI